MKFLLMLAGMLVWSAAVPLCAETVALWDFNSLPADNSSATGSLEPAIGHGLAAVIGGVTSAFSGGNAGGQDDTAWQTTSYAPVTNYNKTAGVQFWVDTTGYTNLVLSWDERHSASAGRYTRLRYSLNNAHFYDGPVLTMTQDSVFVRRTIDLAALPGAANNPLFTFQLLGEFERTATGAGTNAYVATQDGAGYSYNGTVRFDTLTVTGTLLPGANSRPNISTIDNQVLRVGQTLAPVPFTVWDYEDAGGSLTLQGTSLSPEIVPTSSIRFDGNTGHRTLSLAAGYQPGLATIRVVVKDAGGNWSRALFNVTVLPLNTAPFFLFSSQRTNTLANVPVGPVPFAVGDLESDPASLVVSATTSHPELVPLSGIVLGGSGSNRTLSLQPAPGQSGVAALQLTVKDGVHSTTAPFAVLVRPSPEVIFYDPFNYADGSLLTNSAGLWANRSGSEGECEVAGGRLRLDRSLTEDVIAPLVGAPYNRSNGVVLYASFNVALLGLPRAVPEYFAHFADGGSLRGRISVGTTNNAGTGMFRLFVANSSSAATPFPTSLKTNTIYRAVMRYNIDSGITALWVDPKAESDPAAVAVDAPSPARVSGFAFRESSGLGTVLWVDELRVGLSFAAVAPGAVSERSILRYERQGSGLVLLWDRPNCVLQGAVAAKGPFSDLTSAVSPHLVQPAGGPRFFRLRNL